MRKMKFAIALLIVSCNGVKTESPRNNAEWKDAPQPQVFAEGVISTGDYETHAALSPTGDTVYFLKCMPDIYTCAICVSYRKEGAWSQPVVTPFSGRYLDVDPFVTKDGNTLYFASNRPWKAGDSVNPSWDVWRVERTGDHWGQPEHLDSSINSSADEFYPTVADNGKLYFGSSRPGGHGGSDIYSATPSGSKFTDVQNLGDSVNTPDNEYEAFIARDESFLIFMATVPRGLINADFYISYHRGGSWTKAKKLEGPVNSSATEWAPKITRDGKYFYFGSTRNRLTSTLSKNLSLKEYEDYIHQSGNGLGDIYYMNTSSLPLPK